MKPDGSGTKSATRLGAQHSRRNVVSRGCDDVSAGIENRKRQSGKLSGYELGLRLARGHLGTVRSHENIYLASDPEGAVQIDAGLHGKTNPWNERPVVVGLIVVQVR